MTDSDAPPDSDAPDSDAFDMAVSAYLRAHRDQILSDLSEWVECASIAGDPAHALDLIRSATWLAGRLRDAGFEAEVVETGDSVAVVAALAAPGARARPALEVLTIAAGETSGPPRAVIPARASATLSVRTVPDQSVHRVADQLRRFVAEHMADGCTYTLQIDEVIAQEAYTTPRGPELEALERALARGWGAPPRGRMGNAGGGPADVLSEVLGGTGRVPRHRAARRPMARQRRERPHRHAAARRRVVRRSLARAGEARGEGLTRRHARTSASVRTAPDRLSSTLSRRRPIVASMNAAPSGPPAGPQHEEAPCR